VDGRIVTFHRACLAARATDAAKKAPAAESLMPREVSASLAIAANDARRRAHARLTDPATPTPVMAGEVDPDPPEPSTQVVLTSKTSKRRSGAGPLVLFLGCAAAAAAVVGPRLSSSADVRSPVAAEAPAPPPSIVTPLPFSPIASHGVTASPPPRRVVIAPKVPAGAFVHPIPGPERELPANESRLFGADRPGERAPECGQGHCGVDLGELIGTPILAARDGDVVMVQRDRNARGGRFVQVRHAGGLYTWYFHLDEIRSDLAIGMRVRAGEPIATLGRTGITNSAPHLHFAMTVEEDGVETYVDPMPYLRDAVVVPNAPLWPDDQVADEVGAGGPDPAPPVGGAARARSRPWIDGIAEDLDAEGALIVRGDDGRTYRVLSGEVVSTEATR
jgi:murein DD-endopeptidase MepM/ murein hydrolase activator NlpD